MKHLTRLITLLSWILVMPPQHLSAQTSGHTLEDAKALIASSNFKESYDIYHGLLTDPAASLHDEEEHISNAFRALTSLGREAEVDQFAEDLAAAHPNNWRVLKSVGIVYDTANHGGYMVSGQFSRGWHRRSGKMSPPLNGIA